MSTTVALAESCRLPDAIAFPMERDWWVAVEKYALDCSEHSAVIRSIVESDAADL
jgi:hypothetical protein